MILINRATRVLAPGDMNAVADAAAYARPDIGRAIDDAEMTDAGYVVTLSAEQSRWIDRVLSAR